MEYPHEDSGDQIMRRDSLEEALSSMIDSSLSPTDGIIGGPAVGIGGAAPLILPALAMTQPGIRFTTASTVPTEFHQPEYVSHAPSPRPHHCKLEEKVLVFFTHTRSITPPLIFRRTYT